MDKRTLQKELNAHAALAEMASCQELKEYHEYFIKGLSVRYWGKDCKEHRKHSFRWVLFDSPDRLNKFRGNGYRDGYNFFDMASPNRKGRKHWRSAILPSMRVHVDVHGALEEVAKERDVPVTVIRRTAYMEFLIRNVKDSDRLFFRGVHENALTSLRGG